MSFVRLYQSPVAMQPCNALEVVVPMTLSEVMERLDIAPEYFEFLSVKVGGIEMPEAWWPHTRLKPGAPQGADIVLLPQGKKTLILLATIAAVAATAWIGGGGIATAFGLGAASTFAEGGLGAILAATAVGLGTQLAIGALSAPPKTEDTTSKELSQAGIAANLLARDGMLPVVLGRIGASPQALAPTWTSWDGDATTVYAALGVEGRCLIENIKINGIDAANFAGAAIETREGAAGETPTGYAAMTVIEQRDGIELSNFKTQEKTQDYDKLIDQVTPANSDSQWHYFKTDGEADEALFRLVAGQGLARTDSNGLVGIPFRIEVRRVGDVAWRKLPTIHCYDKTTGISPLRFEVSLKWKKPKGGRQFSNASGQWPVYELARTTGDGTWFQHDADAYFNAGGLPATIVPVMTGPTTSGVTITASSEQAGNVAWYPFDGSATTMWRPALNSLPAWLKIDFGTAQTVKSFYVSGYFASSVNPPVYPTKILVEGSNDNVTWADLNNGAIDLSSPVTDVNYCQIENHGAYRYYRFTFQANNGAANQELWITAFRLFSSSAWGSLLGATEGNTFSGNYATMATGVLRCRHGYLTPKGAEFYLDPATWPKGKHEIRVRRGASFDYGALQLSPYQYGSTNAVLSAYFFDHDFVSGSYVVKVSPKTFRGDVQVEVFQTIENVAPFDGTGIAQIYVAVKNTQVQSVYGEFTRYAPVWQGGVWSDQEFPTRNPAALFRQAVLRQARRMPWLGPMLQDDELGAWYDRCVARGYECNSIVADMGVADGLKLIAAAGYASPRIANIISVIEDRDMRAEPITMVLSPMNSKSLGTENVLPSLPHGLRCDFQDEADSYNRGQLTVYSDGFSAANAQVFETQSYPGFTSGTKVAARAAFDLKQLRARRVRHVREVSVEGFGLYRGQTVGLADDILDGRQAAGFINAITTVAGNIVSITLNAVMPWGAAQDNLDAISDVNVLPDLLNMAEPMGLAIRRNNGVMLKQQVSNVSDSNTCLFSTAFVDDGTVEVGNLVVVGRWGVAGDGIMKRCRIMGWKPSGEGLFRVELAEAAEDILF